MIPVNLYHNLNVDNTGDNGIDELGNLIVNFGGGGKTFAIGGRFSSGNRNEFFIGGVHVQLGRFTTDELQFDVTFDTPFDPSGNVYVFIQEEGNDPHVARVEYGSVTHTGFTVVVQESDKNEGYAFIAFGRRA